MTGQARRAEVSGEAELQLISVLPGQIRVSRHVMVGVWCASESLVSAGEVGADS